MTDFASEVRQAYKLPLQLYNYNKSGFEADLVFPGIRFFAPNGDLYSAGNIPQPFISELSQLSSKFGVTVYSKIVTMGMAVRISHFATSTAPRPPVDLNADQQNTWENLWELVEAGQRDGLVVSVAMLEHYLGNSGAPQILEDTAWVRAYAPVTEGETRIGNHFKNWLANKSRDKTYGTVVDILSILKEKLHESSSSDESVVVQGMLWQGGFEASILGSGGTDQFNAIGDAHLNGVGDLTFLMSRKNPKKIRVMPS